MDNQELNEASWEIVGEPAQSERNPKASLLPRKRVDKELLVLIVALVVSIVIGTVLYYLSFPKNSVPSKTPATNSVPVPSAPAPSVSAGSAMSPSPVVDYYHYYPLDNNTLFISIESTKDDVILLKDDQKTYLFNLHAPSSYLFQYASDIVSSPGGRYYGVQFLVRDQNSPDKIYKIAIIDTQAKTGKVIDESDRLINGVWLNDSVFLYSVPSINDLKLIPANEYEPVPIENLLVKTYNQDTGITKEIKKLSKVESTIFIKTPDGSAIFADWDTIYKIDSLLDIKTYGLPLSSEYIIPLPEIEGYGAADFPFNPQDSSNENVLVVSKTNDIYILNTQQFTLKKITSFNNIVKYASLSPDGTKLAAVVEDNNDHKRSLVYNDLINNKQEFLSNSIEQGDINWSPDGMYFQFGPSIYSILTERMINIEFDSCSGGGWSWATHVIWAKDGKSAAVHDCFENNVKVFPNEGGWKIYNLSTQKVSASVPKKWKVIENIDPNQWKIVNYKAKRLDKDTTFPIINETKTFNIQ